jgi:hypothetical protein
MRVAMNNQNLETEDKRICNALAKVGVKVNSIYDLVNSRAPYPEAIPVLLSELEFAKNDKIIEGIARALTVKEARGVATKTLIKLFKDYKPSNQSEDLTKWAIGNAISYVADETDFEDIVKLSKDKQHGSARQMLPGAFARIKGSGAINLLIESLSDEDLADQAIRALGKLRASKAKPEIAKFLDHPQKWVRDEAKRALVRIEQNK